MKGILGRKVGMTQVFTKDGKVIPSKVICCVAWDLGFTGIAYINYNYTHLDVRTSGTYYGDETRGNSSYWTNPYTYFGVSKSEVEKYTGTSSDNKYQSHGLNKKWYPNVIIGSSDYAGVFGVSMDGLYIDKLKYRVKVNGRWLPEVVGRNDYAETERLLLEAIAIDKERKANGDTQDIGVDLEKNLVMVRNQRIQNSSSVLDDLAFLLNQGRQDTTTVIYLISAASYLGEIGDMEGRYNYLSMAYNWVKQDPKLKNQLSKDIYCSRRFNH